jgi:hypothetical protein
MSSMAGPSLRRAEKFVHSIDELLSRDRAFLALTLRSPMRLSK